MFGMVECTTELYNVRQMAAPRETLCCFGMTLLYVVCSLNWLVTASVILTTSGIYRLLSVCLSLGQFNYSNCCYQGDNFSAS